MHLRAAAIVLAVRQHGEHGAIVRCLTREAGLLAGYVRGGRSRLLRPVLQPANAVLGNWRARTNEQLPALTVELVHSRAGLHGEPLAAAALEWITALTAMTLPEGQPYPRLHDALDGVIAAIEAAPLARGWVVAVMRYEMLILGELGYGLDRPAIMAIGDDDGWPPVLAALRVTGDALARHLLTDRRADALAARERLVDRLLRAVA
ncbi:DNA repair protein RecO [uncultured Sphingomonas sp.]|uniref:DNA repair protein RecO n=1 Tax=uncultured Sphingomonas sp. TaxID=158754 RepID=UPI0035CC0531